MSKVISMKKEDTYKIGIFASNFLLALAVMFVVLYSIAPLFGGKLFVNAIIKYASWIAPALALKFFLKRLQQGLRMRVYDYIILCISSITSIVLWWAYPFNIILSVLTIISSVVSYRAQSRRAQ